MSRTPLRVSNVTMCNTRRGTIPVAELCVCGGSLLHKKTGKQGLTVPQLQLESRNCSSNPVAGPGETGIASGLSVGSKRIR